MPANRNQAVRKTVLLALGAAATIVALTFSLGTKAAQTAKPDRWLHVRVVSKTASGETVRVNLPLELAIKILPTINQTHLHGGRIRIDDAHVNDVDLRAILGAIRTTKDGEFVTVQSRGDDVRVAKENGYLLVRVSEHKSDRQHRVEVRVPMTVVTALVSGGKDELDLVAALVALANHADTELVTVQDDENTVRIWLDSKNSAD